MNRTRSRNHDVRAGEGQSRHAGIVPLTLLLLAALPLLPSCSSESGSPSGDSSSNQKHFESPAEAANGLLVACRNDDTEELLLVLGRDHEKVFVTSDPQDDREARLRFSSAAEERIVLSRMSPTRIELLLGHEEWPMPIPVVQGEGGWRFDTAAGVEEILRRRVGRNELEAIEVCRGIIAAQEQYKSKDWDGDGVMEYARRIKATPGKKDGLYWPADPARDDETSPLHGFFTSNQDYAEGREEGSPWRGYHVSMLERQGDRAPGGQLEFVDADNMTAGFAVIVWPAEYGSSGVMSFLVSHHGTICERDLGPETTQVAAAIDAFNPDEGWVAME